MIKLKGFDTVVTGSPFYIKIAITWTGIPTTVKAVIVDKDSETEAKTLITNPVTLSFQSSDSTWVGTLDKNETAKLLNTPTDPLSGINENFLKPFLHVVVEGTNVDGATVARVAESKVLKLGQNFLATLP